MGGEGRGEERGREERGRRGEERGREERGKGRGEGRKKGAGRERMRTRDVGRDRIGVGEVKGGMGERRGRGTPNEDKYIGTILPQR